MALNSDVAWCFSRFLAVCWPSVVGQPIIPGCVRLQESPIQYDSIRDFSGSVNIQPAVSRAL